MVCYPAGADTVELDLEKKKGSEVLKLTHLQCGQRVMVGDQGAFGSWQLRQRGGVVKRL